MITILQHVCPHMSALCPSGAMLFPRHCVPHRFAQQQYLTSCSSRLQRVGVRLPQVNMDKARSSMPARTWETGDPGFMAEAPSSNEFDICSIDLPSPLMLGRLY